MDNTLFKRLKALRNAATKIKQEPDVDVTFLSIMDKEDLIIDKGKILGSIGDEAQIIEEEPNTETNE